MMQQQIEIKILPQMNRLLSKRDYNEYIVEEVWYNVFWYPPQVHTKMIVFT